MKYALAMLTLIGCTDSPTLATEEQGLACSVGATTETESTFDVDELTHLAVEGEGALFPEVGDECSQYTVSGRMKLELCWAGSATLEEIQQCLHDLVEGTTPEREKFCLALVANHDVTMCSESDISATLEFRDEACKLQTRKHRKTEKPSCLRLGDVATVPHPSKCTTILDGAVKNEKFGDVNNCPRCASCGTPSLEP